MLKRLFKNKTILVTGGTGSIGSEIVKALLKYRPRKIRIYSRDESKQLELSQELKTKVPVIFLIGDVRDKERLNMAMENIDIVFHAAAMKHVVASEKNPFEAVKTNVEGTQNIIECAFANNVERVIGISTDKAADPISIMGCTKLLSEKLMLSTFFYKGNKKTKFCFVRFGNVLGSRGSIIPLFVSQIKNGGPVTITDYDMTRFFMSTKEAVNLVLKAASLMKDREIFILKMPVLRIGDLAKVIIDTFKSKRNNKHKINIKVIGKRPGEQMHEKLLTLAESEMALETKDMFILTPNFGFETPSQKPYKYPGTKKAHIGEYSSKNQKTLTILQIKTLLKANHLIDK